jgi:hypothetical protein
MPDDGAQGRYLHVQLEINGGALMMTDHASENAEPFKGMHMQLVVDDGRTWWERAVAAGRTWSCPASGRCGATNGASCATRSASSGPCCSPVPKPQDKRRAPRGANGNRKREGERHDLCRGLRRGVPTAKREAYARHAAETVPNFRDLGVRRIVETWGDDVPPGKVTDFPGAVQATPEESWSSPGSNTRRRRRATRRTGG